MPRFALSTLYFMISFLLYACNNDNVRLTAANCELEPQSVIISELFSAGNNGVEWVELYNRSANGVSINRIALTLNNQTVIVHDQTELAPGAFVVIGNNSAPFVDIVINNLNVPNETGHVALLCKGTLVNEVSYSKDPALAKSRAIDGGLFQSPSFPATTQWCPGGGEFAGGNGTPGAANPICGTVSCMDNGVLRPARPAAPGTVRINEVFADPAGVDAGKEWVELAVDAQADFDLNGLVLSQTSPQDPAIVRRWQVADQNCLGVQGPQFSLIGIRVNGQLANLLTYAAVVEGEALVNQASIFALAQGESKIDEIFFPAAAENISWAKSTSAVPPYCHEQNDTGLMTGSPGGANSACPASCEDTDGWKPIRTPRPSDLILTEVYSGPPGISSPKPQWLELYVNAAALHLNGVLFQQTSVNQSDSFTLQSNTCIHAGKGEYVIIGTADALPGQAVIAQTLNLSDAALTLTVISNDGDVVDQANLPAAFTGASRNLHGLDGLEISATSNDTTENFCAARSRLPAGYAATPGAANDPCGYYCKDADGWRLSRLPLSNQLVINEVLALSNLTRPWLELQALADMDLNHLALRQYIGLSLPSLQNREWSLDTTACVGVTAGAFVFISQPPADTPDGLPAGLLSGQLDFISGPDLTTLEVGVLDYTTGSIASVIDHAVPPLAVMNTATQLGAGLADPANANDGAIAWCQADPAAGTPGQENGACQ